MKKQRYFLASMIGLVALGIFFYSGKGDVAFTPKKRIALVQEQTEAQTMKPAPSSKKSLNSITSSELKSIRTSRPDKLKMKEEVASNPHTPPKSLNKFAKNMGPLMEKALKNGGDAGILINELHECAYDESVALSARALCVSNSEKLGNVHPEMKQKAGEIRANVSPDVQKLLNDKDKSLNN
jgi:hypothetical protein